jgi:hypothetical protein
VAHFVEEISHKGDKAIISSAQVSSCAPLALIDFEHGMQTMGSSSMQQPDIRDAQVMIPLSSSSLPSFSLPCSDSSPQAWSDDVQEKMRMARTKMMVHCFVAPEPSAIDGITICGSSLIHSRSLMSVCEYHGSRIGMTFETVTSAPVTPERNTADCAAHRPNRLGRSACTDHTVLAMHEERELIADVDDEARVAMRP